MICKNCKAEYDGSAAQCPECGMENEAVTERFDDKADPDTAQDSVNPEKEAAAAKEETEEAQQASCEEKQETEQKAEIKEVEEKPSVKKIHRPAEKRAAPKSNLRRRPVKATKQEKRTAAFIVTLMCLVGVCAGVITFLNITTDIFRPDTSDDKVVAGVGLIPQEEKQLEELLAKSFSVTKNDFGGEGICAETLLAKINPADKGNVYSRINGAEEVLCTQPDPADRFADENGEYAYYKLSEKKVDAVLGVFGTEAHRGENGESYYYYDGWYYYFAARAADTQTVNAEITKTKRVLNGSYYAEFYFYTENEGKIRKSKTRYLIADMNKDEATGQVSFEIKRTSSKPVISSDGKLVDSAKIHDRKTQVIEGRTKNGILFCRYVVEYPVLTGEEAGCNTVNGIFKNTVSDYESKAETKAVEEAYKQFIAAGGDKNQLPYVENVVAAITFEDENDISFTERIYKYDSLVATVAAQQQESAAVLYSLSVESYTVDKQTGDFVSKDSVIGKNYLLAGEVLYRIYNGYEYDNIFVEEYTDTYYEDEIPEDVNGQGTAIYESAWALTEKGVSFFYITEKGYVSEVAVPKKVLKKLTD